MGNHAPVTLLNIKLVDLGKGYQLKFEGSGRYLLEFYSCLDDALQDLDDYMEAFHD